MEDLLNLIGNVGFPIAVSVYLLIRVENKLSDLTSAIGDLREAIITLPRESAWQQTRSLSLPTGVTARRLRGNIDKYRRGVFFLEFIDYHLIFGDLTVRQLTRRIVVHHSASKDVSVLEIHRWHLAKKWAGIGYHYVIRKNGQIELGRPVDKVGTHTQGANTDSIGICLTGNFMNETPTPEQLFSLAQLIQVLENQYGKLEINRHRDLSPTNCPGDLFPWEDFLERLTAARSSPSPEVWKQDIMSQAKEVGLIFDDHLPDDLAPKWFVLAVGLNILNKMNGK